MRDFEPVQSRCRIITSSGYRNCLRTTVRFSVSHRKPCGPKSVLSKSFDILDHRYKLTCCLADTAIRSTQKSCCSASMQHTALTPSMVPCIVRSIAHHPGIRVYSLRCRRKSEFCIAVLLCALPLMFRSRDSISSAIGAVQVWSVQPVDTQVTCNLVFRC